jgi:replicative DNA helicase
MERLTELEGRSISRSEALQTARQILETAEQERLAIVEREAEDAADTGRNRVERIDEEFLQHIERRLQEGSVAIRHTIPELVDALRAAYARIDELEEQMNELFGVRTDMERSACLTSHHGGGKTWTAWVDETKGND